jgi:MFS superfamily sulfate permease-like transporter
MVMNGRRIAVLVGAVILTVLIVWHDLPIEFPGAIGKVLMLFVKLSVVVALTIIAYIFTGRKKKPS